MLEVGGCIIESLRNELMLNLNKIDIDGEKYDLLKDEIALPSPPPHTHTHRDAAWNAMEKSSDVA